MRLRRKKIKSGVLIGHIDYNIAHLTLPVTSRMIISQTIGPY